MDGPLREEEMRGEGNETQNNRFKRRTSMSGKTVSLTMTVRELDAIAFACLREHAKLGLLRRSQPELKGLEEAYALYSGLLSEMLALQKEFSDVDEEVGKK